jgi:uncharacterized delta-60 repeat protein
MLTVRFIKFALQKLRDLIQFCFIFFILFSPIGCTLNLGSSDASPTSSTSPFKITTDIGTNSDEWANAMAVQNDGKILVAGGSGASGSYDFTVVRYNSDSTLDSSFGTGGKAHTDIGTNSSDGANAIALQSDGKIVLAGNSTTAGATDFAVARYNSDGTLDSSFGTAGKVTTDIGTNSADYSTAMAVQSDGKILVSGYFNAGGSRNFVVVRYNSNGTLDASFGTGGKVTTDIGTNSDDQASAVTFQSDGKILLAGGSNAGGSFDFAVVRYNSDGTLDASFGTGGKVTTDIGTNSSDGANAIALQSNGKILLAGQSNTSGSPDFVAIRYNSDGTLDASFGTGGKVTTDIGTSSDDRPYGIQIESDGKILLAGNTNASGSYDFAVARYNSDGTLDSSFGTSGKVTTDIGTNSDEGFSAIRIESDGKILLAGNSDTNDPGNTYDFALVRILANGQ